jgi:archaetidylinositol phosphate synthase
MTNEPTGGGSSRPVPLAKPWPPPKTWIHAVARWMIVPLINTPVTPNHLTTVRLVTAILAAGAFAVGTHVMYVTGGIIFMISAVFDRADGELARLSRRTSPGGHAYDLIADVLACTLTFVGFGIGLRNGPAGLWSIGLGVLAGVAIGLIFWLIEHVKALKEDGGHVYPTKGGFDPDDGLFLIGPIAFFGAKALWPLLVAGAIGAPLFALWTVRLERKVLFGRRK